MPEANVVNLKQHQHQPGIGRGQTVGPPAHGTPPPALEVNRPRDEGVREFDQNSTGCKGNPGVDFRISFAGFVERAELQVFWLKLLNEGGRDGESHEDGKESGLKIDLRVANVVKGESVEEAGDLSAVSL